MSASRFDIRPVDLADDALMSALEALERRSALAGREWAPMISAEAWIAQRRGTDLGERQVFLAAFDGGRPLGTVTLDLPLLDNLDKAYGRLAVEPAERGTGVGSALIEALIVEARSASRRELLVETAVPTGTADPTGHPHLRFAVRHGFTLASSEVVRHQQIPVAEADLAAWSTAAAEHSEGYTVKTFAGSVPDDLAASLCVLMGQLAVDAPSGAVVFEEEVITPERLAQNYTRAAAMDMLIVESLALTADREVAAQSTLVVPLDGTTTAWQWGTFVHREHRGHRLGLAVKTANLRTLQRDHPAVRQVTTQNDETNHQMVAINELMGFEPVETNVEMLLRL